MSDSFFSTFLTLLKAGMYGQPVPESDLPDMIDWPEVCRFAQKQAVLGVIIDSVQYLPARLHPSASTMAKMNKFALGLIQANLVSDQGVARLSTFLAEHGIEGVLLKGQGISRCYRVPQMRQNGDIDFYVGKHNYKKASDLCLRYLADKGTECGETDHHFTFNMDRIPVELHRYASRIYIPVLGARFQKWIVEQLEGSAPRRTLKVGDADIALPSYDFDAIFIFYHAWRHLVQGGIGFRQLMDWTMIFYNHSDEIDTDRLVENIRRFGMTEGWKLFAIIAVDYLGLPREKMPLYDPQYRKKSEKILAEIIDGGNFGYYAENYVVHTGPLYGFKYSMDKIRYTTDNFISLFPLIPFEATCLYVNHLYRGAIACLKRAIKH